MTNIIGIAVVKLVRIIVVVLSVVGRNGRTRNTMLNIASRKSHRDSLPTPRCHDVPPKCQTWLTVVISILEVGKDAMK